MQGQLSYAAPLVPAFALSAYSAASAAGSADVLRWILQAQLRHGGHAQSLRHHGQQRGIIIAVDAKLILRLNGQISVQGVHGRLDAGMTAHLSKPIEISALEGILIEMQGRKA